MASVGKSHPEKRFPTRGSKTELREDTTEGGRYIPYSGGCLGWFNNSGVLKSEIGNDYSFHTVLASDMVRMKQFERASEHWARRRSTFRVVKSLPISLMMHDSNQKPVDETSVKIEYKEGSITGKSNDISLFGMSMQFLAEPNLAKGDEIVVCVLEPDQTTLMEVKSEIIWINKLQFTRPVWNVGIAFTDITKEINVHLNDLMH